MRAVEVIYVDAEGHLQRFSGPLATKDGKTWFIPGTDIVWGHVEPAMDVPPDWGWGESFPRPVEKIALLGFNPQSLAS